MKVAVVEKAISLLEFLAMSDRPVSLAEASAGCGMPKPSTFRLLGTLQSLGYVSRPLGRREYLMGPRAGLLAKADPYVALKEDSRSILRSLNEAFDETINLGVLSGTDILYVEYVETTRPLRMVVAPGRSDLYFHTALGRAIASQLGPDELEPLISKTQFEAKTSCSVRTESALRKALTLAKRNGYAEEVGESVDGVACLATSLIGIGHPEAAVSITVPVQRYGSRRRKELIAAIQKATKSL